MSFVFASARPSPAHLLIGVGWWCCARQRSVGCIQRYLKQRTQNNMRIGAKYAVYAAAILEYLTAEVLELAGARHPRLYLSTCADALVKVMRRRIYALSVLRRGICNWRFVETRNLTRSYML